MLFSNSCFTQQRREKGRMRVHHLNNVNKALQILEHNNVSVHALIYLLWEPIGWLETRGGGVTNNYNCLFIGS